MASFCTKRLLELTHVDPSRKILQKIVQAAVPKATKKHRKIGKILRVKSREEILLRYEKHREMVKVVSSLQHHKNPRNLVDGNELLQFYGTTMACTKRKQNSVNKLCYELNCQVCRIIGSYFDTEYTRKHGIQLSRSSQVLTEIMSSVSSVKKAKRAVIVCRTIAGSVDRNFDVKERENDAIA
ncbi:uncharacterized protein LOC115664214 [Syzygium oleosum]|uniref:uncharacterized protein LOC115664214 n=1 Tax=Syzygium oleosum TaxID=219896 RepID=UPI0024B890D4|nr:uncharacterized protein LOC115664214 [Syzygium oleosum]